MWFSVSLRSLSFSAVLLVRDESIKPVNVLSIAEYVNLYVNYLLNKSIYRQFASFYHGFHSVCASNALIVSISDVC